jgi:hypothetical protein
MLAMTAINNTGEELPSHHESRSCPRKRLMVAGWFLDLDAFPSSITIVDISKEGMGILASGAHQIGDMCAIGFSITLSNNAKRINVWAKVVYCVKEAENLFKIGVHIRDWDIRSKAYIEYLCQSDRV